MKYKALTTAIVFLMMNSLHGMHAQKSWWEQETMMLATAQCIQLTGARPAAWLRCISGPKYVVLHQAIAGCAQKKDKGQCARVIYFIENNPRIGMQRKQLLIKQWEEHIDH